MDGRVKTLHPAIHGGLLGVRDDPDHASAMDDARHRRRSTCVVVNLYPFEEVRFSGAATTRRSSRTSTSAARRCCARPPRTTPMSRWSPTRTTMRRCSTRSSMNFGSLSLEFRKKLAAKAFARTAAYDAAISGWFAEALAVEHPVWRAFGGRLRQRHALWREPAPGGRLLRHRRQAPGRRDGAAAAGQAALLQQHQRHRRRLRAGRRVRSRPSAGGRHHQARQPLRRGDGRDAEAGLSTRRCAATRSRPSAASSRSTARSTPRPPRRSSRPSPR